MENKSKVIRKRLLDLERDKRIEFLSEQFAQNGLLNSGIADRELGRVKIEYQLKKELIDHEGPQESKNESPIFKESSKWLIQWKLEKIFKNTDFETYPQIAIAIGRIKSEKQFRPIDKNYILKLKKTFNKHSRKIWHKELKASRSKVLDGLKLIPAK